MVPLGPSPGGATRLPGPLVSIRIYRPYTQSIYFFNFAPFLSGNYHESLNDARAATALQPTYIKAIMRGKVFLEFE